MFEVNNIHYTILNNNDYYLCVYYFRIIELRAIIYQTYLSVLYFHTILLLYYKVFTVNDT